MWGLCLQLACLGIIICISAIQIPTVNAATPGSLYVGLHICLEERYVGLRLDTLAISITLKIELC